MLLNLNCLTKSSRLSSSAYLINNSRDSSKLKSSIISILNNSKRGWSIISICLKSDWDVATSKNKSLFINKSLSHFSSGSDFAILLPITRFAFSTNTSILHWFLFFQSIKKAIILFNTLLSLISWWVDSRISSKFSSSLIFSSGLNSSI